MRYARRQCEWCWHLDEVDESDDEDAFVMGMRSKTVFPIWITWIAFCVCAESIKFSFLISVMQCFHSIPSCCASAIRFSLAFRHFIIRINKAHPSITIKYSRIIICKWNKEWKDENMGKLTCCYSFWFSYLHFFTHDNDNGILILSRWMK